MRPLIVFTPKSMLRNKAAVSDIRDFTEQKFRSVLEEPTYTDGDGDRTKVRWVLLTSWQALLRAGRPQDQGHAMASRSCASSSSRRRPGGAGRDAGPVPQRRREVLGAGGVGHRRLAKVRPGAARAVVRTGWPASSGFRGGPSAPSSGSSKVHAVERQEILDEAFT